LKLIKDNRKSSYKISQTTIKISTSALTQTQAHKENCSINTSAKKKKKNINDFCLCVILRAFAFV